MRWTLKPIPNSEKVQTLAEKLNVNENIAKLLVQRGIETFEAAKEYFRPDLYNLHDPFLMKGMEKAVERILEAVEKNQRIMVYGDYDVDGTTSVALMSSYLETLSPQVTTYIPDRYLEGYGVSFKGIDYAADNDIDLIITLDCGIKAVEKIAYAKEKNIDVIICDHHRPGERVPDAVAVLDPKQEDCFYPYKELCGCGVGFKLVQAIHKTLKKDFTDLYIYLDLVATAIGADIVPITGENRILAFYGLKVINQNPRVGFKALLSQVKKDELTITDVVFIIAPRINAAGRMKHGIHAVNLMKEQDLTIAMQYASEIEAYNADRRSADQNITQEALAQIQENQEENRFTTVVYDPDWHKGVIGIVASRLTETFYRPTLVFTKSGDKLAASARSVKGFDVYNALEESSEFIEQFGGHKYAAGLTLQEENYQKFKNKFEEVVASTIQKNLLTPEINIDIALDFEDITPKFYRIIKQMAPFGPGNMNPVFLTKGVRDKGDGKCVGTEDKHLKCCFEQNNISLSAIGFNLGPKCELISNKKKCTIAYTLDENHWNGSTSLQLKLKDVSSI